MDHTVTLQNSQGEINPECERTCWNKADSH